MQKPNFISNSNLIINNMSDADQKVSCDERPLILRQIFLEFLLFYVDGFFDYDCAEILDAVD